MINIIKLSSTNYLTWSVQINSLLRGYDLVKFIDNTIEPPSPTVVVNGDHVVNPSLKAWQRQDNLIFNALMGAIETSVQPLIATSRSTLEAWNTLATTYGKPTRGHIKQLKQQLKLCVKGTKDIDGYMQLIKTKADALALLGSPLDSEDLTDIVLEGLCDDYKSLIESIHRRDTPISFHELQEKLLHREIAINSVQQHTSSFPVTANYVQNRNQNRNWRSNNSQEQSNSAPRNQNNNNRRPYLGKCQACGTQGHSAKFCPLFRLVQQQQQAQSASSTPTSRSKGTQNWPPQAYNASTMPPDPSSWLLDSGATHHITSDLANLALHSPYNGSEEVMVGNGHGLPITHTDSVSLPHSTHSLSLQNVLAVQGT